MESSAHLLQVSLERLPMKTAVKKVTLKQGWNQVYFRIYNVGYAPFKIGLILKAPEEQLWPLKFSNRPSQ